MLGPDTDSHNAQQLNKIVSLGSEAIKELRISHLTISVMQKTHSWRIWTSWLCIDNEKATSQLKANKIIPL